MTTSHLKSGDTGGLIAMIGASCRLPGASSLEDFWRLLVEEKNVIQARPSGRWSVERFLREGEPSPGFSYSFAGGYLDDPFQFDPMPFGISLREAAQTDPQQRLLLELVWQAFEDAGVSPDQWKGRKAGVYVGASNIDYQGAAALDVSVIESHFATGNALSILANRISYVFDFKGPSLTVDTACSSSLVALRQASEALAAGDIDFAVVAGVNLLLSPTPFIGFAQARMLSPTGRSRPFCADADGYVRAEGGAVVLLARGEDAARLGLRVRSYILGCAVNSDGLTSGIALPSSEGQRRLIDELYASLGVDPDALAFVEAHGTGTQAGDPIEALALGRALGLRRRKPLPIGSVKSNIGHLEAASGLIGLLKASLALERRLLPRSLFSETLNPDIDFEGLNLQVAQSATPLDLDDGPCLAGVCNYGFGGTNAHLVLRSATPAADAPQRFVPGAYLADSGGNLAKLMLLSAASPDALKARALLVCAQIETGESASVLAAAYVRQQPLMAYRLATPLSQDAVQADRLRRFAGTSHGDPAIALGSQRGGPTKCAFIFSGNGSQFPDMGRAAYATNADFRHEIHLIDEFFKPLAGWSIANALQSGHQPDLYERTSFIQPLIFAIQSALAAVMARYGVHPAMVLGHSIGEIAAAECCGALTREQAIRIIFHRSNLQESVRGEGGMLVVAADKEFIVAEMKACGAALEIAALNSQTSTTVVGPHPEVRDFARHCRARRVAAVELDLDYPFHSSALDRLEAPIIEKLSGIAGREGRATFISTVSGGVMPGVALDPAYWWRNLRSAVRFQEAICEALIRPEDEALRGFARVAINEYPMIDLRIINLTGGVAHPDLRRIMARVRGEREISMGSDGVAVLRVHNGICACAPLDGDERSVLRFRQPGRVESFEWVKERRAPPKAGEVEIEVAATGLNFRDVMVGLGALDDDLLQAGLTNSALGFECSGTVLRIGEGVVSLAPGDRVMGFASGAFASHLVAPAWQFMPVPQTLSFEAAATIPVAFATAWHSLMERAHLAEGDDVLIHGAAGGVGLAAIQIAKRAGARVIGTASTEARRAIAAAQGADLVFESRGVRFVDGVRAAIGGVDVVLNSLDGAGMLASFHLLKPFGRFIEIGKKDFLNNTHLGLRPFVRNIMYAGVDLDELLSFDRRGVERMMGMLGRSFESGELHPLPHQAYEAHEIGAAFRAMQASEHVGKIVIRPSRQGVPDTGAADYKARDGVYLIVGGTSGLGFATAKWLGRQGASTVMLASRRGQIEEALQSELDQLRESGVTVLVEALDVRDQSAVNKVTRRLSRDHGPLRGVVHAAAQLDDGLIAGLQGDRLRAVLGAKIQGALNLESATAGEDLDFFVVYSSATTMVGSPGQGAYVAANAFLEGFAQRRRAAGEPALAIGWGAIADVGLIARDRRLAERLKRSTGVVGVKASEALSHLGRLLALGNRIEPIQFYAMIAPASGASRLALLKSPAFASLDLARESSGIEDLDSLESALRDKSRVEAHAIMLKALQREAGRILRMPQDQIDPQRALSDLGFDSLMMLELTISVERVTGQQFRIVGEGERTLAAFANLILNEMAVDLDDAPEADASSASGTQSPPSAPVWTGHHEPPQMESLKRPAEMDAKG